MRDVCLTIFLVQAPELKVAIAPPSIVELVGICDLGDNRARVFCERVEEDAVSDDSKDLDFLRVSIAGLEIFPELLISQFLHRTCSRPQRQRTRLT